MAAQYDVNLEKCAVLNCLCGEWKRVCCRTGSVRSLALKISVISGHTDKSSKILLFLSGSVVEHCVSSAKGCGFDSQGTHVLMKMEKIEDVCVSTDDLHEM